MYVFHGSPVRFEFPELNSSVLGANCYNPKLGLWTSFENSGELRMFGGYVYRLRIKTSAKEPFGSIRIDHFKNLCLNPREFVSLNRHFSLYTPGIELIENDGSCKILLVLRLSSILECELIQQPSRP